MTLSEFTAITDAFPRTPRMPALFVGHGSPMNGIVSNVYSRAWENIGKKIPRPQAILCISAHWLTAGTYVHIAKQPRTIYDFYGFPEELYRIAYPCPGGPEFAQLTRDVVKQTSVLEDFGWGIDHGAWIVLLRMFPNADVPVFQMSIDIRKPASYHYALAKELVSLRDRGVLILGSGNIVHNLGVVDFNTDAQPYDWALEFDERSKKLLIDNDHEGIISAEGSGKLAELAIPTPDHYIPLLYTVAQQGRGESLTFPVEGIAHGSVSMRSVLIGG